MTKDFLDHINQQFLRFSSLENLIEDLYIAALVESKGRVILIPGINKLTENKIRDEFVKDLEFNNTLLGEFLQNKTLKLTNENRILPDKSSIVRTDIEFFISIYGTFVVECKRLTSADQRYVDEGVQRFTSEKYSKDADEAGMIGFVINGNIDRIMAGLQIRVAAHNPSPSMKLQIKRKCFGNKHSFHSEHSRKTKGVILLHHLFFDLTKAA